MFKINLKLASLISAVVAAYSLGMLSGQIDALPYRALVRLEYATLKRAVGERSESAQRVGLFNPNAQGATTIMIGDSLTNYMDWNLLLKRSDIINYGVPGDTSSGLLKRVANGHIENKQVFFMIGVNDLSHHLPVEYVASNIRQAVAILAPKNKVYLEATLLTKIPKLNKDIKLLNEAEASICAEYPSCARIDLNPAIVPSGTLADDAALDDVHISLASYDKWAAAILPYLKKP